MNNHIAVAIDGPVGVGKSTQARRLAERLGFVYIDSGAMYRAVALYNMRRGVPSADETAVTASLPHISIRLAPTGEIFLNNEDITREIRNQALAEYTSNIAAYAAVRAALTQQQRALAADASVVMDGRDIGSQVLPNAQIKIYLDAEPLVRAERRFRELQEKGVPAELTRVWEETLIRDERDKNRQHAPLVRTADAIYIDASHYRIEETHEAIYNAVMCKLKG
jgi:cytidylate kinase